MSLVLIARKTASAHVGVGLSRQLHASAAGVAGSDINAKARSITPDNQSSENQSKQFSSAFYGILGGLAVTVLGGVKYVHDHVGGTEGLARTMSFYSTAIPKYIEYRMHMILESPDEVWDDLHEDTSKKGLEKILEVSASFTTFLHHEIDYLNITLFFADFYATTLVRIRVKHAYKISLIIPLLSFTTFMVTRADCSLEAST